METAKRILTGVKPGFLLRSHLIGFAFFAVMAWTLWDRNPSLAETGPKLIFPFVLAALFPFSKLVWNETRDFLMADNVIWMNAWLLLFIKVIVNACLWAFSPFIAPIGLLYLWWRTRVHPEPEGV